MLGKSLLLALWAGYCSYDDQGPQMLRRPLLVGPIAGIILGDLHTALVISATLELMWMGLGNMAGYQTPDMIVGTIVGISFSVLTGNDIAAGIALATTVAILSQQLMLLTMFIRQFFFQWADNFAKNANWDGLLWIQAAGIAMQFLIRAVPTFLVIYFGTDIIDQLLAMIPSNVLVGMGTASRVLPAVGLSILMTIIMKKGMWGFLLFGFVLNAYLKVDVLGVTIISFAFGTIYLWFMEQKDSIQKLQAGAVAPAAVETAEEEGVYDL